MRIIKSTLSNLKGHKLRVFFTMLWIIIGITSVVMVSSIGNGLKQEIKSSVNKVNPNKTKINFEPTDSQMSDVSIFLKPFTKDDLETLSFIDGVERIESGKDSLNYVPSYYEEAIFNKKSTYIDISELKKGVKLNPIYGRNFSFDDENRKVIIITMQNAIDLFNDPKNAIGKGITFPSTNTTFEVIGVIDESSIITETNDKISSSLNNMYYEDNTYITSYIPKKALNNLINQYNSSQEIYSLDLIVSKGYDVFDVSNNVIDKLYELHPDINGSYSTPDPSQETQELENMISTINKFITLITFISMFVGGVGVMNIMYVSVMERQREIGIRRSIGAKPRTIMLQFLLESIFITVCGGILGIIIGFIVINYISNYLPFKAIPNINSFLFATITTIITGTIFGIIPAYKASKLDPIKAIYK